MNFGYFLDSKPKNEQNIRQNSAVGQWNFKKKAFEIYWPLGVREAQGKKHPEKLILWSEIKGNICQISHF
jgi:hypothetical protein